ncbi:MAG: hypothetical protein H6R16_3157, partial [Proteobacteria bacterium]|nr:hypothetical protein [Pseudomonadota bacterium]
MRQLLQYCSAAVLSQAFFTLINYSTLNY